MCYCCWLWPGVNHRPNPIWSHAGLWQTKAKPAASSALREVTFTQGTENILWIPTATQPACQNCLLYFELSDLMNWGPHVDRTGNTGTQLVNAATLFIKIMMLLIFLLLLKKKKFIGQRDKTQTLVWSVQHFNTENYKYNTTHIRLLCLQWLKITN